MHEVRKRKKYRTDISRRENMAYDAEKDTYTCANGKELALTCEKHTKSASGFPLTTSVYECQSCGGCPMKEKCIRAHSKKPLQERHKGYLCIQTLRQTARTDGSQNHVPHGLSAARESFHPVGRNLCVHEPLRTSSRISISGAS